MPTRFKPVSLNLDEHAKLVKIADRKSKESGHPVSPPQVVIALINKFGDKV